jgi:hypothetical protein
MQKYLGALVIVLLVTMVITRVWLLKKQIRKKARMLNV